MAKKRHREEPKEFTPPDFDEVAFMKREVEGAKAAIITLLLAAAMGGVSALLTVANLAPVGFVLLFVVPFTLKFIYPAGRVNVALIDRKGWAALVAMLILTWFSLWVLFINPPFADTTPPVVKEVRIQNGTSSGYLRVNHTGDHVVVHGASEVTILAYIPDNSPVTATFLLRFNNNTNRQVQEGCDPSSALCTVLLPNLHPGLTADVSIDAVDAHGNRLPSPYLFSLEFQA